MSYNDFLYTKPIEVRGGIRAGQGGEGRWQLLGGSGRYADVTGGCSYETEYLEDNWLVSIMECEWERP